LIWVGASVIPFIMSREAPLMITRTFCEWAHGLRLADVPVETLHAAKGALLNCVGVGIAGTGEHEIDLLIAFAKEMGAAPTVKIWGRAERLSPDYACLVHGTACHVLDYDDTDLKAMVHPSPPLVPALLATAATQPVPGGELLLAYVIGVELELRLGANLNFKGYHPTALLGNLGAAVGVGRLLHLSPAQLAVALWQASTQAAGLVGMNGTMAKSFHVGKAAMNGYLAAKLAAAGFNGRDDVIENKVVPCLSIEGGVESVIEGLGDTWYLHRNVCKPYACGVVAHPAIDAMQQIRREHPEIESSGIASIDCFVHSAVVGATGIPLPKDELEARFSTAHAVAAVFVRGKAGHHEFSRDCLDDPQVRELTRRVTLHVERGFSMTDARVSLTLQSGEVIEKRIREPKGSIANPMSDEEIDRKFIDGAEPVLGPAASQSLLEQFRSLEQRENLDDLLGLL